MNLHHWYPVASKITILFLSLYSSCTSVFPSVFPTVIHLITLSIQCIRRRTTPDSVLDILTNFHGTSKEPLVFFLVHPTNWCYSNWTYITVLYAFSRQSERCIFYFFFYFCLFDCHFHGECLVQTFCLSSSTRFPVPWDGWGIYTSHLPHAHPQPMTSGLNWNLDFHSYKSASFFFSLNEMLPFISRWFHCIHDPVWYQFAVHPSMLHLEDKFFLVFQFYYLPSSLSTYRMSMYSPGLRHGYFSAPQDM